MLDIVGSLRVTLDSVLGALIVVVTEHPRRSIDGGSQTAQKIHFVLCGVCGYERQKDLASASPAAVNVAGGLQSQCHES